MNKQNIEWFISIKPKDDWGDWTDFYEYGYDNIFTERDNCPVKRFIYFNDEIVNDNLYKMVNE